MLPFFQWLESFAFGAESIYTVAFINVAHLLALVVFIGALLVVDLRLLGSGMRRQPLSDVVRSAQPWLLGGFAAMFVTGSLQVLGTPMKAYYSDQFWLKMQLLVVAVIMTLARPLAGSCTGRGSRLGETRRPRVDPAVVVHRGAGTADWAAAVSQQ